MTPSQLVYAALKKERCYYGLEYLAEVTGLSLADVNLALSQLSAEGSILSLHGYQRRVVTAA